MSASRLRVCTYGENGHQIHQRLLQHPRAILHAVAGYTPAAVARLRESRPDLIVYETLEQALNDPAVDLVSLCSPVRAAQADEALRCMAAGKHVYAEKPCACIEADLDRLLEAANIGRVRFHEMAGTAFEQPYYALRELVAHGRLGDVVQVFAQKSYPWHEKRPADEAIDGGLILQNGVHAMRFVEHAAGVRVAAVEAFETTCGNPAGSSGLRMAASVVARLENGGVASLVINYLNPRGFGRWGNEHVRIFGTRGFAEIVDGGSRTAVVLGDAAPVPLKVDGPGVDWFDAVVAEILDGAPMPLSLEDELHPLRAILWADAAAKRHGEQHD